ncbi:uncharacterized protein BDR25DRAFT_351732 [Lindgomyces ingoldianus]|uniref:Uncharacterized protein n=1 Tax=Lindgomyces ingoldianus TaxID=673940 RepID=A0ACB6R4T1_9PLEO|nr:uncharacterized protein BDR25DRAFT_351732 [Lindgomyces ingoldianus]KAF2474196.1 hypothetical protein BDR25DRAFT_351732 [Lindgomyces ingoldianus]
MMNKTDLNTNSRLVTATSMAEITIPCTQLIAAADPHTNSKRSELVTKLWISRRSVRRRKMERRFSWVLGGPSRSLKKRRAPQAPADNYDKRDTMYTLTRRIWKQITQLAIQIIIDHMHRSPNLLCRFRGAVIYDISLCFHPGPSLSSPHNAPVARAHYIYSAQRCVAIYKRECFPILLLLFPRTCLFQREQSPTMGCSLLDTSTPSTPIDPPMTSATSADKPYSNRFGIAIKKRAFHVYGRRNCNNASIQSHGGTVLCNVLHTLHAQGSLAVLPWFEDPCSSLSKMVNGMRLINADTMRAPQTVFAMCFLESIEVPRYLCYVVFAFSGPGCFPWNSACRAVTERSSSFLKRPKVPVSTPSTFRSIYPKLVVTYAVKEAARENHKTVWSCETVGRGWKIMWGQRRI